MFQGSDKPIYMGPPRESSVRNLMEKVGNLRDIAVLVQLNLAFLTFIDLHLHSQTVSDYHPLFLNGLFQFNFFLVKIPFKIEDDNPRQFDCVSVDL